MKLLPNKKTSKNALYFITIITLIIALLYGIAAEALIIPDSPEIVREVALNANSDTSTPDLSGIPYIQQDIEQQIRHIADDMNFPWPDYAIRLTYCESRHDPLATNTEGNSAGTDRGLWQINSYYHPDVSDECAYDVDCSTRWSMQKIIDGGQGIWVCDKLVRQSCGGYNRYYARS